MKPIVFDVGRDEVKMKKALERIQNLFGNQATLLYDSYLPTSTEQMFLSKRRSFWQVINSLTSKSTQSKCVEQMWMSYGKKEGGPWECYKARSFVGWETEKVIAVTKGESITNEMLTRAKTHLAVILVQGHMQEAREEYARYQSYFQLASDEGLVELVSVFSTNGSSVAKTITAMIAMMACFGLIYSMKVSTE